MEIDEDDVLRLVLSSHSKLILLRDGETWKPKTGILTSRLFGKVLYDTTISFLSLPVYHTCALCGNDSWLRITKLFTVKSRY